jgi:hypothetical protein
MSDQEHPLPKGYENESIGFKRAFAHAKRFNNPDKSALLYARDWAHEFEEVEFQQGWEEAERA